MKKILLSGLFISLLFLTTSLYAQRKYQGEVNIGYGGGVGKYSTESILFDTKHGVRWSPHFYTGLGMGLHYYAGGTSAYTIPVYVNFKGYLMKHKITPYLSADIGYGIGCSDFSGNGGLYVSPALGLSIRVDRKSAFIIELGFLTQQFSIRTFVLEEYPIIRYVGKKSSIYSNAVSVKIGFSF